MGNKKSKTKRLKDEPKLEIIEKDEDKEKKELTQEDFYKNVPTVERVDLLGISSNMSIS